MIESAVLAPAVRSALCAIPFLVALYGPLSVSLALEVEPSRLELTVPADGPAQEQMTISNPLPKAVSVRISRGAYRFLQEQVKLPSAEEWLGLKPDSFVLAPGASTVVELTATPPPNILQDTAAEYVAAILVDELPAEPERESPAGSSRINVVPRLALPVYVQIHGRKRLEVELAALKVSVKTQDASKNLEEEVPALLRIDAVLKNRGTVHVRPTGSVTLFDGETGDLTRSEPLGRALPLFPTAAVTIPTFLPLPRPGSYRAVVTIEPYADEILQSEAHFQVTDEGTVVMTEEEPASAEEGA